jgi:hypothetical protein
LKQVRIGLADLLAEKFHDASDAFAGADGEAESAMQAFFGRD